MKFEYNGIWNLFICVGLAFGPYVYVFGIWFEMLLLGNFHDGVDSHENMLLCYWVIFHEGFHSQEICFCDDLNIFFVVLSSHEIHKLSRNDFMIVSSHEIHKLSQNNFMTVSSHERTKLSRNNFMTVSSHEMPNSHGITS
jgi:hypothetical protein